MAVSTFGVRPTISASAASALGGLSMNGRPFRARGQMAAAPGAVVSMPAAGAAALGGLSMGGRPFNAGGSVSYYNAGDPGVPVAPAPKPPASSSSTQSKYSFSVFDDPTVRAARDAMPGIIDNAQKSARNSILARLLQYGDPGLSGILDRGAAKQMLDNLKLSELGGQALDLLSLDKDTQDQIARAYGAETDPAVMRDMGPSGLSQRAQFDRAMAQTWRQRLGNLTGRGAVRSGDLGYQEREQQINRDVGIQNLVSALLGGIGGDVAGVNTARQQAQQTLDTAIQNARNLYAQNPEGYAAMFGVSQPTIAPDTSPVVTQTPSAAVQSALQQALDPTAFGVLQSALGGRR